MRANFSGVSAKPGAVMLARKYPKLSCVVQDLPRNEAEFNAGLPSEVAERVVFQAQDFFEPQTQKADVFVMKHVLHNWPDKDAVKILHNLVSALNPAKARHTFTCR